MYMDWGMWQRPDGKRISIEIVGLDDHSVGGPWKMKAGRCEDVHLPQGVIIDEAFLSQLGVTIVGDEVELFGKRAIVRGISQEVRTFTASPFVFMSLESPSSTTSRKITQILSASDSFARRMRIR
jgi:putative ABC transport system permease protein